jgi:hypothetical protein
MWRRLSAMAASEVNCNSGSFQDREYRPYLNFVRQTTYAFLILRPALLPPLLPADQA